ncbi:LD-carboxypeptidase [Aneurinibacillus sp. Ricciae_BoGa-3]|uniref:S66 peptidase family protein n=1 Tax=Aneurinibacillus sp. Ricciae_BoGa-3 TaxID=3022697 RepID=UPI0023400D0E|nr:LD-carboxypeptidase [Aneurinibacillus sp. Ricciae_BoGa-3]WCK55569.1 LD-carboxypeptidase [Aneurinibacillus sp. Ricciae_BoGa-3]
MESFIKPAALKRGDTVGVVAPAGWPDREKARKAESFFTELGLHVQFGQSLDRKRGYLAGTDQERADELHRMFADKHIRAIFCACGGYGTARVADRLNYDLIAVNPKIFWGYSDITFLHTAIYQKTGLVTFHGPMLASDLANDISGPTRDGFRQLFEPQKRTYSDQTGRPFTVLVEGAVSGMLVGGNLTLIVSTLGTPYEIDTKGKLLLIEDVDEEPYRVDRMLNQLRLAGKLRDAAGIILGDFCNCAPSRRGESLTLEQVFADHIVSVGKPTVMGLNIGHCSPHFSVPLGVHAALDTAARTLAMDAGVVDKKLAT